MENQKKDCPICGAQMDDNHFTPVLFPGIDEPICCNCDEDWRLVFNNIEKSPGDNDYIAPYYSDRLEQITGRPYIETMLLYFQDCLRQWEFQGDKADAEVIKRLKAEIENISQSIKKGHR